MALKSGMSFSDIEPNVVQNTASIDRIRGAFIEYASMTDTPDELPATATLADAINQINNLIRIGKKEQQRRRRAALQMK
jgi:hypothetical protein